MRDLNRLLRGNGLYIKQAPTQLGLNTPPPPSLPCHHAVKEEVYYLMPAALLVGFDNL